MKIEGIRFEFEDDALWIIWHEKDHQKLWASEVKKLYKFLKKSVEGE